ncbi:uncharacterized protein [Hoplias malabaricus]|uniref:uncharacterized protein n=1 Tax=Hoplias malabaricus TaxID=27720 RepID=UPI003462E906
MTQGIAGIGKSVCLQKFILDWAEGEAYEDIKFIFPLPFRELNLKKGNQSLMDIIYFFFPETKGMRFTNQVNVMFIFDGLDECQLSLNFHENETLYDVSTSAPLDVVLTNLIKGNLLPSALLWITTRPAAASKIPAEFFDQVTELRGFNDEQKEEYFRKRISDETVADKVVDHIKKSRSLHIMCHIPVFCWISATVLQKFLEAPEGRETPKTLTEMYMYFLIFQTIQGNLKYSGKNTLDVPWDKEGILSLGKLAFQHLKKNSLIFYTEDLEECEIDLSKISVYSGLCTQETVRFHGTIFSFVHLSIQEFLAALFAYTCLRNDDMNVFDTGSTSQENKKPMVIDLLKAAVDKALKSEHGHLDLFLRFLLGLSLESNEILIRGLLKHTRDKTDPKQGIVEYIKSLFENSLCPERSINLFYCLNELNDDSLVKEVQKLMSSGGLSEAELSPAQWSALVFVLRTSKEKLEVFDLQKFIRSDECLQRLMPVVKDATTALLSCCGISEEGYAALVSDLKSNPSSNLVELDLRGNDPGETGVKLLTDLQMDQKYRLELLRLLKSDDAEKAFDFLTKVLETNPLLLKELELSSKKQGGSALNEISALIGDLHCKPNTPSSTAEQVCAHLTESLLANPLLLKELDLRGNDPGESGVQKITDLQEDPNCKLKTIRLLNSSTAEEVCARLTKTLGANPLLLKELDLSGKLHGDSEMKQLTALLEDLHCRPVTIKINRNNITGESCPDLVSALKLNSPALTELDLSENNLGNAGVKQICPLLNVCKLQTLRLSFCSVKEEGYADLALALKSKPSSHLTELDLRGNDPGESGVEKLSQVLDDQCCKLKKLKLLTTPAAEEACAFLKEKLNKNPLLLKVLDLSGKIQGDTEVEQLCPLFKDSHCKIKELRLCDCNLTERSCSNLCKTLSSDSCILTVLDFSRNTLHDKGVQLLSAALQGPQCKLETLRLSYCGVSEEGYTALASALKSNPSSNLVELDLRGNDPGETGVKLLTNLQMDQKYRLKTLRLLKSDGAEKAFDFLTKTLETNPLLLKELDLSGKIQGGFALNEISPLLGDLHCRPNTLRLVKSSVTDKDCGDLASALCSNPTHLIELDLSENKLSNSGVQELCKLLANHDCKLQKLGLSSCSLEEEGYSTLASALKSNSSSQLKELDLRGNDPGESGVRKLVDLQEDPNCKLKTIRLLNSSTAEEVCARLTKTLGANPLLLKELDLSGKIQGDSEMKQFTALLEDLHCRPLTIKVNKNNITGKSCTALVSALKLNSPALIELELSENNLGNSGVKYLCPLLNVCKLHTLKLSFCSVKEEGYADLALALKSKPSLHLRELDLRGNDPGESGVEKLSQVLDDQCCKLKKLKLLTTPAAEEACAFLKEKLNKNPLLLKVLDLSGKIQGDTEVEQLCPLFKDSHCKIKELRLCDCNLTERSCSNLCKTLSSDSCILTVLDFSRNTLHDKGVQLLSAALQGPQCKLETLRLSYCGVSEEGYTALASALKSNPSSNLVELDLRGNDPGETGVKLLTNLQMDQKYRLKTLRLLKSDGAEKAFDFFTKTLETNPLLLKELDLSGKIQGGFALNEISPLLGDLHCRPNTLRLVKSSVTDKDCGDLASALCSNPTHLIELDLSENKLSNSGVQELCKLLANHDCKLQKLGLSSCSLEEEGYSTLASALKSNSSSQLKELDLRGNDPGESGVRKLVDLQEDPNCKLKTIRLLNSSTAEEVCARLTKTLGANPLLLKELDLSGKIQGDSEMKQFTALLEDLHCRPLTIKVNKNNITGKSCTALVSALKLNSPALIELELSENNLGNSGVKYLCPLLNVCKLHTLKLSFCSVKEEGYADLALALKSKPSLHLRELDLRGNDPGESGVEKLSQVLDDQCCKLKKLKLLTTPAAEEACAFLKEKLNKNPLLLKVLDLSGKIQGDTEVEQLCPLFKDSHCKIKELRLCDCNLTERSCSNLCKTLSSDSCILTVLDFSRNTLHDKGVQLLSAALQGPQCKLETLRLSYCGVSEEGYTALASALKSNPSSNLVELDLRGNDPGETGVKLLTNLQMDQKYRLKTLRLLKSDGAEKAFDFFTKTLETNPLLLKELDLSGKIQGGFALNEISPLLGDLHCRPNTLRLVKSSVTDKDCGDLASALCSNPTHLIELDLSENKLSNSGVQELCKLLANHDCKLQKLGLSSCSLEEEGYSTLASALKSNSSSQLKELDLRGNDPGESGVRKLVDLQEDPNCKLKTIRLLNSSTAEEVCARLTKTLGANPLLLKELDLSGKIQGDSEMKQFTALLEDLHCRPLTIKINKNNITGKSCTALVSALKLNSPALIELELSENNLGNSGVKYLCPLLNVCKLHTLKLSFCSVKEEGYADLALALKSKPSLHLRELDLRGNDPGESGVEKLSQVLDDQCCKLKKLKLLTTPAAEEACAFLKEKLNKNPLLLKVLDLSGKIQGDTEVEQLCPLFKDSHCKIKELRLCDCNLTERSCSNLCKTLSSDSCILTVLDFSRNTLHDKGVQLLSAALQGPQCKLETLRLSYCGVSEEGYTALASALKSNPSSNLVELDLRGNDPGETGVKLLTNLQMDQKYRLKTLRLLKSDGAEKAFDFLTKTLETNPLLLKELDLSGKIQGGFALNEISPLLGDLHCRPNTLRLVKSSVTDKDCGDLASALCSNPTHLIELDLSENKLSNSGVQELCKLLANHDCKLQKLGLSSCSLEEEGYSTLASALKSNSSSQLKELDLRGNDPGESGVRKLVDLQEDPNCKLKTIRLLNSSTAEEVCARLTKTLGANPLLLKELDLSGKIQGDSEMKQFTALLEDLHCRPLTIKINKNNITGKSCTALVSALKLNSPALIELELSENNLGNSGVKYLCPLLNVCKLHTLKLSFCSVKEEGYADLALALKSKPSLHLRELDLRGNDPGESGVEKLSQVLDDQCCKLKKLKLLTTPAAEEACAFLKEKLNKNPLLLKVLDLSGKIQGDTEVEQLCPLFKDSHCKIKELRLCDCNMTERSCSNLCKTLSSDSCMLTVLDFSRNTLHDKGVQLLSAALQRPQCKLETLRLSYCGVSEEGYTALASALKSNPSSNLVELDLRGNDPGETGVKLLTDLKMDQKYRLKILRLLKSDDAVKAFDFLIKTLGTNPLLLKVLDLSGKIQGDTEVEQLCPLFKDSHCKIKELMLSCCNITMESSEDLVKVLYLDSCSLRKMDLSNNSLHDSGLQKLATALKSPKCKLEILMLNTCELTKNSCSSVAEVLSSKHSKLKELDLSNNNLQDFGVVQLSSGMNHPGSTLNKISLSNCSIREEGSSALASVLGTHPSNLIELDLSGNNIGPSGVHHLSELLKNSNCRLQKLKIMYCNNTEEGYVALASALKSNPLSQLIELDLRGNDPGESGVKLLNNQLENSGCKLKTLRLVKSSAGETFCIRLTETLKHNPLLMSELDLNGKVKGDSEVTQLCALLQDSHCRTKILRLQNSSITEGGCAGLSKALCSNPSHLEELDLSNNIVGNSGVQQLCSLLTNQNFKLRALRLSYCSVTERGYKALASALKSNPSSPMTELDLRGNHPGESGVRHLTDLQKDPIYNLKTLRLLKSSAGETFCVRLTETLKQNPLLMTELDLSGKVKGDTEVTQLCALLEDSHCRTKILRLQNSSITEGGCSGLSKALCSNPSHLEELDLSKNTVGDSGVQQLCSLLTNQNFKLRVLRLPYCNVTERAYTALASALKSNPSSPMTELDLRGNDPGESGVRLLTDLQKDPTYHLKTLRLVKSSAAETFCVRLTETLKQNPLLMNELDLSGKVKGDSEVNQLCALLEDSHCRTKILRLQNSSITERGCAALSKAFCSKPSHLEELDLSNNIVGDSGVEQLCSLLTNQNFKLRVLRVRYCSVKEGGYTALASALKLNPSSQLIELDLRGNDPGDKGVKALTDTFKGKTKKLRLLEKEAEEACRCLKTILGENPLLQRELDLSERQTGDIKVKQLSALLQDPHYRLEKFTLYTLGSIQDCGTLVSALNLNPSHLKELDLNKNKLDVSGLKELCNLLKNPLSKLEKLKLNNCNITESGVNALTLALTQNPSRLKNLDLRGNKLGRSKDKLSELLKKTGCYLQLDRPTTTVSAAWSAATSFTSSAVSGFTSLFHGQSDSSQEKTPSKYSNVHKTCAGVLSTEHLSEQENNHAEVTEDRMNLGDNAMFQNAGGLSNQTGVQSMVGQSTGNLNNQTLYQNTVGQNTGSQNSQTPYQSTLDQSTVIQSNPKPSQSTVDQSTVNQSNLSPSQIKVGQSKGNQNNQTQSQSKVGQTTGNQNNKTPYKSTVDQSTANQNNLTLSQSTVDQSTVNQRNLPQSQSMVDQSTVNQNNQTPHQSMVDQSTTNQSNLTQSQRTVDQSTGNQNNLTQSQNKVDQSTGNQNNQTQSQSMVDQSTVNQSILTQSQTTVDQSAANQRNLTQSQSTLDQSTGNQNNQTPYKSTVDQSTGNQNNQTSYQSTVDQSNPTQSQSTVDQITENQSNLTQSQSTVDLSTLNQSNPTQSQSMLDQSTGNQNNQTSYLSMVDQSIVNQSNLTQSQSTVDQTTANQSNMTQSQSMIDHRTENQSNPTQSQSTVDQSTRNQNNLTPSQSTLNQSTGNQSNLTQSKSTVDLSTMNQSNLTQNQSTIDQNTANQSNPTQSQSMVDQSTRNQNNQTSYQSMVVQNTVNQSNPTQDQSTIDQSIANQSNLTQSQSTVDQSIADQSNLTQRQSTLDQSTANQSNPTQSQSTVDQSTENQSNLTQSQSTIDQSTANQNNPTQSQSMVDQSTANQSKPTQSQSMIDQSTVNESNLTQSQSTVDQSTGNQNNQTPYQSTVGQMTANQSNPIQSLSTVDQSTGNPSNQTTYQSTVGQSTGNQSNQTPYQSTGKYSN